MEMTAITLDTDQQFPSTYALLEMCVVPSIAPEYEHGPNDYFNIYLLNTVTGKLKRLDYEEAKSLYKKVSGKRDRVDYWSALQKMVGK
jgi:hypothetical protein